MKNDMTKTKDITEQKTDTTRDYITTEVTTESEGPKETTMKDTTEQITTLHAIYILADAAAVEAETRLDRIYYHGTSMNQVMLSLSKIKSLLDVIKEQTSGLYNDDRENGEKDE